MEKPSSGNTDTRVKTGKSRINRKSTYAKINKKLTLFEIIQLTMENNNITGEGIVNMSDLDILNDTTLELELNAVLSTNEPSIQGEQNINLVPEDASEIPEDENSTEEHDAEPNQDAEPNTERLNYEFETVEGERYTVQGTSDGRVQVLTLDQGGNQTESESSSEDPGAESANELSARAKDLASRI